jgi:hypothetical protein
VGHPYSGAHSSISGHAGGVDESLRLGYQEIGLPQNHRASLNECRNECGWGGPGPGELSPCPVQVLISAAVTG